MVYFLLLGIVFVLSIAYFMCRETLNPAIWLIVGFFISALDAVLNKNRWGVDISFETTILILYTIIVFTISCLSAPCISLNTTKKNSKKNQYFIKISHRTIVLFFVLNLVITIVNLIFIMQAASLGGSLGGLKNMFTFAQVSLYDSESGLSMNPFLNYGLKIIKGIDYIITYELLQNLFFKKSISKLSYYICALYIVQSLLSTGRTLTVYYIIFIATIMCIFIKDNSNWGKSSNKKIVRYTIVILILILIIFRAIGVNLRGSIYGTNISAWDSFSRYLCGPIFALDKYIASPTHANIFGEETLYALYSVLNKLGFGFQIEKKSLEFVSIGSVYHTTTNVYGALRRYIYDFGFAFSQIIVFAEGTLFGSLFKNIKKYGTYRYITVFYAASVYSVVFFFFEERFLTGVISVSNVLTLLVMYVTYRYFRIKMADAC